MIPGSAPRVQKEDLENAICGETYTVLPDGRTTICQLTLYNGFSVIGQSACVSAENFDAEVGRQISRANAVEKLWPLLGFRLAERICQLSMAPELPVQGCPESVVPAPEVGQPVLYFEQAADEVTSAMAGIITEVLNNRYISCAVFAPNGSHHPRQNIVLLGPEEEVAPEVRFFARRKETAA